MKNKFYNEKIDEVAEKVIKNKTNQNDSNKNLACTYFKFVSFFSIIDQII